VQKQNDDMDSVQCSMSLVREQILLLAGQGTPGRTLCLQTGVWWVSPHGMLRTVT